MSPRIRASYAASGTGRAGNERLPKPSNHHEVGVLADAGEATRARDVRPYEGGWACPPALVVSVRQPIGKRTNTPGTEREEERAA